MNRIWSVCILAWSILFSFDSTAMSERDTVTLMIEKLEAGRDIGDWEQAIRHFVRFQDPRVLPVLIKLTGHEQVTARAEAAGILWRYDIKEVRERLLTLSRDEAEEVRIEASKSLSVMGYTASFSEIVHQLSARKPDLRARAARAMAAIGNDKAKAAIRHMASRKSEFDQIWAAFALHQMGIQRSRQLDTLRRFLLSIPGMSALKKMADPDADDLKRFARQGAKNLELRLAAAEALSRIGGRKAISILALGTGDRAAASQPGGPQRLLLRHGDMAASACIDALTQSDALVRLGCIQVLGRLPVQNDAIRKKMAQALGQAVSDKSSLVRLAAMRSFIQAKLQPPAGVLTQAMQHSDPAIRRAAILAAASLNAENHVGRLLKQLNSEKNRSVRKALYKALAQIRSPRMVTPLFDRLTQLYRASRQNSQAAEELPLCIDALAAGGETAAEQVMQVLDKVKGEKRQLLMEVLAKTGSQQGIAFFMDRLRESPPKPDSPAVRFFDSLDTDYAPRLKSMIETETAMWIRVVLARALYRMGMQEFGRGIIWGLKHEDEYYRRLAASLANGLKVPGSVVPLIKLLRSEPETARFAARSLMSFGTPKAIRGLLSGGYSESLRKRTRPPIHTFWEGPQTASRPYAKEVDNDRVWILFAEDRIGRNMDLFLTWSDNGLDWHDPVFTGLTSFADPEGQVPPPTFSMKVRDRKITVALTRTFAESASPTEPRFKTIQRIHQFKLEDLNADKDKDGLSDIEETAIFTHPHRWDSDDDGLADGKDKNPLARPMDADKPADVVKFLAFAYADLIAQDIPTNSRLLVVEHDKKRARLPELTFFPGLVLHLDKNQIQSMWRETGAGYPRVSFGHTSFNAERLQAIQPLTITEGIGEIKTVQVEFTRQDDQWLVRNYREVD